VIIVGGRMNTERKNGIIKARNNRDIIEEYNKGE
jgi:hypothetical protein